MGSGSADAAAPYLEVFRKGLRTAGYTEGQNVSIEYRWAAGGYDSLPVFAAELVRKPVNLIACFDNTATALAAKAATTTIPIVFAIGTDPIKYGLVESLSHPTGNITGVVTLTVGLGIKRLQVFRELLPNASLIGILVNPKNPAAESEMKEISEAAAVMTLKVAFLNATTESEIDLAFAAAKQQNASGVLIVSEPFLTSRVQQISALGSRYSMPVIDAYREFPKSGGLVSYGASLSEARRVLGIYAGRILKGEKPENLPVQRSTKVELIVNLKTARALGLTIPTSILVRADEVIE
jgi:putative ABC transport system substrate-binding protein